MAHINPQIIKRMIDILSCEDSSFFIHIDLKSDLRQFSGITGENVFFSEKRIPVYWSEFSHVTAVFSLLRQALKSPQKFDYFVLLSGSCYPIRSGRYIRSFLERNRGSEFISLVKVPAPGKPLSRINTLWIPSDRPIQRFTVRALAKVGLAQKDYRKYLGNLEAYSGSTWWALTSNACQYVLKFAENNPHVQEFFETSFVPDEAFYHTILGNSEFRTRIQRNLHYEDWSAQGPHPAVIGDKHLAVLEAQEKVCVNDIYGSGEVVFTRKVSEENIALLQRIDEMIERKERQYSF